MAWLDDRFWAHPKVAGLTDRAYRSFVNGICYSAGMGTRGHLDDAQLRLIGAKNREKTELISRKLWVKTSSGVRIHDWEEHNDKRDERRAVDRERKRLARAKEREERADMSAGPGADSPQDDPQDAAKPVRRTERGQNGGPARAEEVKGEGVKVEEDQNPPPPNPAVDVDVVDPDERERVLKGEGVLHDLSAL